MRKRTNDNVGKRAMNEDVFFCETFGFSVVVLVFRGVHPLQFLDTKNHGPCVSLASSMASFSVSIR